MRKIENITGISVVIPAFNEEKGLAGVIDEIHSVLKSDNYPYEIIIVDDGSLDRTALIAELRDDVRLIRHEKNRGYGAALKTGIRASEYEIICITDADGTYPNQQIPKLIDGIRDRDQDMVIGARVKPNAAIPFFRRPAKWFLGRLAEWVAGQSIPDLNSGLRVFRRPVVLRFFNMLPDGFSFTTTITLAMLVNGYRIEYQEIDYFIRKGKSKIRPIRDTANFVQLVLRIALYFDPLKIFLPFSGFLFILAFFWGAVSYWFLGRVADASAAAILMASIQTAMLGLLADLINHRLLGYSEEDCGGRQDR